MLKINIRPSTQPFLKSLILIGFYLATMSCKVKIENVTETQPKTYLVVSFYSIGMGVNHQAVNAMNNILEDYKKTKNVDIPVNKIPWGREGEIDYCIDIQSIDEKDQKEFINKVHSLLDGQNWVRIKENAQCRAIQNQ